METVTQIFFKEQINVPGESRSPRLQKGKEVFKEFVQKECEQVSQEEQGVPRGIQKELSNDLARLLESLGLSTEEKEALLARLMEQINDLVSSGREEEVVSFLQGLLQVETADGLNICVKEFLALDTETEWGAELKMPDEKKEITLSMGDPVPEQDQGAPSRHSNAETSAAGNSNFENSNPENSNPENSNFENSNSVNSNPENSNSVISNPGSSTSENSNFDILSDEQKENQETIFSEKAQPEKDNDFPQNRHLRFQARNQADKGIEKAVHFLSRKAEAEKDLPGFNAKMENLLETVSYFKQTETGSLTMPSVEEQISPEQIMETKLSLLQDIRQLVEKAEFRQGVKEWQARLELKPEQLGNTLMRLEMSEEKTILDIVVARPEAQELVENSLRELQQIFADKGISIEDINVEVNPQMQFSQQSFAQAGSERNSGRSRVSSAEAGFEYWENQEIYSPEHLFVEREGVNCFA